MDKKNWTQVNECEWESGDYTIREKTFRKFNGDAWSEFHVLYKGQELRKFDSLVSAGLFCQRLAENLKGGV